MTLQLITPRGNEASFIPWAGFEYTETLTAEKTEPIFLLNGRYIPNQTLRKYNIHLKGYGTEGFILPDELYSAPFDWASDHSISEKLSLNHLSASLLRKPVPLTLRIVDEEGGPVPYTLEKDQKTIKFFNRPSPALKAIYKPIFSVIVTDYKIAGSNTEQLREWEISMKEVIN